MAGLTGLEGQQGDYNFGQALDKIRQHTKDEKADIMDKPMDDESLKALIAQDILKNYGLGGLEVFLMSGAAKGASKAAKNSMERTFKEILDESKDLKKQSENFYWARRRAEDTGDWLGAIHNKVEEQFAKKNSDKLLNEAFDTKDELTHLGAVTEGPAKLLTMLIPGATSIASIARSLNEDETKKAAREANKKWLNKNVDDYRRKAGEAAELMEDGEQKKRILNYTLGKGKLLPEDIETIRAKRTEINK